MSSERSNQAPNTESDLLSKIHSTTTQHDDEAKKLQKRRWWIGFSLIVLGPVAVLCSTAEFLWHCPSVKGTMFGALDAVLLVSALVASFWRVGGSQHEEWIRQRLCTEILRREFFLFGARVGPYLHSEVPSIQVDNRLNVIGSETGDLVELVPMVAETGGRTWRDELEESRKQASPPSPDVSSAVGFYLEHRVEDQQAWFAGRSAKHTRRAYWFENAIKAILVLAVILSLVRLKYEDDPWFFFFVILLTVAGVALAGFQALVENERLARSYAYHSARLGSYASQLRALQADLALRKSGMHEVEFRFKRIVLEVEGMFSEELMQWRLVMEPRAPRADA